jgi:hypothetical protein
MISRKHSTSSLCSKASTGRDQSHCRKRKGLAEVGSVDFRRNGDLELVGFVSLAAMRSRMS